LHQTFFSLVVKEHGRHDYQSLYKFQIISITARFPCRNATVCKYWKTWGGQINNLWSWL